MRKAQSWPVTALVLSVISSCHGQGWLSDAECVTGEGSMGHCVPPSTCDTISPGVPPVQCRYSRGYGVRICCPHSLAPHYNSYSYESPITFPEEPVYNPYDNRPSRHPSYQTSYESSYDSRPVQRPSHERPYQPSPDYGYEEQTSSHNGYQGNNRPIRPNGMNKPRPSYPEEGGYHSPDYGYDERPSSNNGYQGNNRPSSEVNRPRPNGSWDYQGSSSNGNRRTTARPTWALDGDGNDDRDTSSSSKRISERKCEEYSKSVSQTIDVLPLSLGAEAVPLTVQKCDFSAVKLIVGGEAAEPGEFPHMAAIGFQSGRAKTILWNCGGTLISDYYVLTAAHCVNTSYGPPVLVRLGEHNLERDDDGSNPVDFRVEGIVVHPEYVKSSKYNDIALLRLSRRVKFSRAVRPACLTSETDVRGSPTATGWGRTDFVGKLSDVLMKVSLDLVDNRQCNQFYSTNNPGAASFSRGIVDTMLCAGVLQGGRDTCLGDSGGPLTITKNDNPCVHYVVGITSFGKVCGAPKSPGVYTRVAKYLSWIERTIW